MLIKRDKSKNKGIALAVTLVLFSVLFAMAASYIISVQYDAKFFRIQEARMQALLLARSGIEYYIDMVKPEELTSENSVLHLDETRKIELEIIEKGEAVKSEYLRSTGIVQSKDGSEIIRKSIIAKTSDLESWTEE
ncbi:MAG: hypothetical protein ABIH00_10345 [Armatimonadota bacterium]